MKAPPIKNIVLWLIAIFMVYAILTAPEAAAEIIGSTWDVVETSARNVGIFFDRLLNVR